jgi:hypothetical protein
MTHAKIFPGAPAVHHQASRRLFMRQAGALSLVAGAGAPLALNLLAAGSAAAQGAGDYRAIVCLFMFGGNDAFNMVLPTDSTWGAYARCARRSRCCRRARRPTRRRRGLVGATGVVCCRSHPPTRRAEPCAAPAHGQPAVDVRQRPRLAIVANIGPLVAPPPRHSTALPAHPRPPRLFSHNDQQSMWQTMMPEGATQGWGGRMADMVVGGNAGPCSPRSRRRAARCGCRARACASTRSAGPARCAWGPTAANLVYGPPTVAHCAGQHRPQRPGGRPCARSRRGRDRRPLDRLRSRLARGAEPGQRPGLRHAAGRRRQLQPGAATPSCSTRARSAAARVQPPGAATAGGGAARPGGRVGRHGRAAPGVLRQPGRLRHAQQPEPAARRPDGAGDARHALLRHGAGRDQRA